MHKSIFLSHILLAFSSLPEGIQNMPSKTAEVQGEGESAIPQYPLNYVQLKHNLLDSCVYCLRWVYVPQGSQLGWRKSVTTSPPAKCKSVCTFLASRLTIWTISLIAVCLPKWLR